MFRFLGRPTTESAIAELRLIAATGRRQPRVRGRVVRKASPTWLTASLEDLAGGVPVRHVHGRTGGNGKLTRLSRKQCCYTGAWPILDVASTSPEALLPGSVVLANALLNLFRLARAGLTLARYGVRFVPKGITAPPLLYLARALTLPISVLSWPFRARPAQPAGRDGAVAARAVLHQARPVPGDPRRRDRAGAGRRSGAAAGQAAAVLDGGGAARRSRRASAAGSRIISSSSGRRSRRPRSRRCTRRRSSTRMARERTVAVKILRPGVERRFERDLDSYYFAARTDRAVPSRRRGGCGRWPSSTR